MWTYFRYYGYGDILDTKNSVSSVLAGIVCGDDIFTGKVYDVIAQWRFRVSLRKQE